VLVLCHERDMMKDEDVTDIEYYCSVRIWMFRLSILLRISLLVEETVDLRKEFTQYPRTFMTKVQIICKKQRI
jgi:hypothetical protein